MITGHLRWMGIAAIAASVAWATYEGGGLVLAGAWLGLLAGGVVGFLWFSAGRRRAQLRRDPALSTLVFPPQSKFQDSAMPRR